MITRLDQRVIEDREQQGETLVSNENTNFKRCLLQQDRHEKRLALSSERTKYSINLDTGQARKATTWEKLRNPHRKKMHNYLWLVGELTKKSCRIYAKK